MFDLKGKSAIVTGGGKGLGKGIAFGLANAGADVAITSRKAASLSETADWLRTTGSRISEIEMDVTNEDSIAKGVEKAREELGTIDILVNNAGCNVRKPSLEMAWDDWDTVVNTNLKGQFFVSKAAAKHMISNGYGRIINIGSLTSFFGFKGIAPYCASRGGVIQLTKSLAAEWADYGVNVNCIAPGWFKTDQTKRLFKDEEWVEYALERIPKGRFGEAEDLSLIHI